MDDNNIPIDDAFRNALKDQEFQFQEAHWQAMSKKMSLHHQKMMNQKITRLKRANLGLLTLSAFLLFSLAFLRFSDRHQGINDVGYEDSPVNHSGEIDSAKRSNEVYATTTPQVISTKNNDRDFSSDNEAEISVSELPGNSSNNTITRDTGKVNSAQNKEEPMAELLLNTNKKEASHINKDTNKNESSRHYVAGMTKVATKEIVALDSSNNYKTQYIPANDSLPQKGKDSDSSVISQSTYGKDIPTQDSLLLTSGSDTISDSSKTAITPEVKDTNSTDTTINANPTATPPAATSPLFPFGSNLIAGWGIANTFSNDPSYQSTSFSNFQLGAEFTLHIRNRLSLGLEMAYHQSTNHKLIRTSEQISYYFIRESTTHSVETYQLQQLMLPLSFQYKINDRYHLGFGPYVSGLLTTVSDRSVNTVMEGFESIDNQSRLKGYTNGLAGIHYGIIGDYRYKFGRHGLLGVRFLYGLKDITDDDVFNQNEKDLMRELQFYLGYRLY